jgi:hypothetical protein
MNELAESQSLVKFLERHNDRLRPVDPFLVDEHQTVCAGHQFKAGVTLMCLTTVIPRHFSSTPCLDRRIAAVRKQGTLFDGAFNFCKKDFGMIGFGMNSMGTHFNPVSLSIFNSESKEAMA